MILRIYNLHTKWVYLLAEMAQRMKLSYFWLMERMVRSKILDGDHGICHTELTILFYTIVCYTEQSSFKSRLFHN